MPTADSSTYDPTQIETYWSEQWSTKKAFESTPDHRPPYTIVLPPPNVTGVLHMGHMLNCTIQDVLIRRARMQGYNACWVPGTDHASIATEAKVVEKLKSEGIDKKDLTREEFIAHAQQWTDLHGGVILQQLQRIGASCDMSRTKFTLDEDLYQSVIRVFVSLYREGLIYRGGKIVHWDPQARTTLSDEEVIYQEKRGKLYQIKYEVEGSADTLTIATTRPETILGDTAVCVHPEDERYSQYVGRKVCVPIANRWIPVIADEYVDREFGTGCLKITPAHDPNDYTLGLKHKLEIIDIFNEDGTLNPHGLHYQGKDRFVVRKEIVSELAEINALGEIEEYTNQVGTSERTGAVIEPRISTQWFLKTEQLAKPALEAVMSDEVKIIPKKFKNVYKHWMENIREWNISRQLYWGHRIPAYYYGEGENDFVVAETETEAHELIRERVGADFDMSAVYQDVDVLDTWFSSWLWPVSVFDGIRYPNNADLQYYYPTTDLVTAPEILFFWVARMVMSGYKFADKLPFKNVYLTGIVRDKKRRKLSKSLGNSPDTFELIEKYGADGVRCGMLLCSPAGNDLIFDEKLCEQGRNFANKLWNVFRLIDQWSVDTNLSSSTVQAAAHQWFEQVYYKAVEEVSDKLQDYRLSEALISIYRLIWDEFCSWYLEMIKPTAKVIDTDTYTQCIFFFESILRLLHPFMPFVTEELWHKVAHKQKDSERTLLCLSTYPERKSYDNEVVKTFSHIQALVTAIRAFRVKHKMGMKYVLQISVKQNEHDLRPYLDLIKKIAHAEIVSTAIQSTHTLLVDAAEYVIHVEEKELTGEEKEKLYKELDHYRSFLLSIEKKLSNQKFLSNAPEKVVAIEQKKKIDTQKKINVLEAKLQSS